MSVWQRALLVIALPSVIVVILVALHAMPRWRIRGMPVREIALEFYGYAAAFLAGAYLLVPAPYKICDHAIPILGILDDVLALAILCLSLVTATIARTERLPGMPVETERGMGLAGVAS